MAKTELIDQRVTITMTQAELAVLDDWRRQQPDIPSRSAAIRRIIAAVLAAKPKPRK